MNTSVPVKGTNLAAKRCIRIFNFFEKIISSIPTSV